MSDYCNQCSDYIFDRDGDFVGMCQPGQMALVLCEGCGPIQVNSKGDCVSQDCYCHHGAPDESSEPIYQPIPDYPKGDFEPLFPLDGIDDSEFVAELERLGKLYPLPPPKPRKPIDLERIDSPEFLEELKRLDRELDKDISS